MAKASPEKPAGRRWLHRMGGPALVVLFVLAQEVVLRLIFPVPEVTNFNRVSYLPGVFLRDAEPGQGYLSNAAFTWSSRPDDLSTTVSLNLYGFRSGTWTLSPSKESTRVAFLGDSLTEGFGVEQGKTLVDVFAGLAPTESGIPLEVMNFGFGAAQTKEYCELLRDVMPLFRPQHVVLVVYANDLPPTDCETILSAAPLSPRYSSPWTPRLLSVVRDLSSGRTVPRAWTRKPFPFFAPVPSPLNPWSPQYARPGGGSAAEAIDPVILSAMRNGEFNPYASGEASGYHLMLAEGFDPRPFVSQVERYVAGHGGRLHIVYLPSRGQVSDDYIEFQRRYNGTRHPGSLQGPQFQLHARLLAETTAALGVPFLDLTPELLQAESNGRRQYWDYDEHMNEDGYRTVGESIARWWSNEIERP